MTSKRSYAALRLTAVAAGSVLVGHWIGYRLAVPDARLRDAILMESGHAYWMLAVKCALLLGVVSLAASGFDAVRRALEGIADHDVWKPRHALFALIVIQVAAFTALEVSERILASEPLSELWHHDVFAWGLAAQLVIAPLGAVLLGCFGRAFGRIARLAGRGPRLEPRPTATRVAPFEAPVASYEGRAGGTVRGPPCPAQ